MVLPEKESDFLMNQNDYHDNQQAYDCDGFLDDYQSSQDNDFLSLSIQRDECDNLRTKTVSESNLHLLHLEKQIISPDFIENAAFPLLHSNLNAFQFDSLFRDLSLNSPNKPMENFGPPFQMTPSQSQDSTSYSSSSQESNYDANNQMNQVQSNISDQTLIRDLPIMKLKDRIENTDWFKVIVNPCYKQPNITEVSSKTGDDLRDMLEKERKKNHDSSRKNFLKHYGDDFKRFIKTEHKTFVKEFHDRSSLKVLNKALKDGIKEGISSKTMAIWFVEFAGSYELSQIKKAGTRDKVSKLLYKVTAQKIKYLCKEVQRLMDTKDWKIIELKKLTPEVCILVHH